MMACMSIEDTKTALKEAVAMAGGQIALAEALSDALGQPVPQQTISWWLTKSKTIPPRIARQIERLYAIPRHRINPDAYPENEA